MKDDKESHAAALQYIDSQLPPRLFQAFSETEQYAGDCPFRSWHLLWWRWVWIPLHISRNGLYSPLQTLYFNEKMNQPLPRYVDYMYSYLHIKLCLSFFPSPVSLVPYLKQVEGQKASLISIFFVVINGYCNLFSLQTNRADYIATYLENFLHKQAQQLSPLTHRTGIW